MQNPDNKTILLITVVAGALAFLLFSKTTLLETFFFFAGIVGIAAYFKEKQLRDEVENIKKRVNEKVEVLENHLEKMEEKLDNATKTS